MRKSPELVVTSDAVLRGPEDFMKYDCYRLEQYLCIT